jgi:hypothetical protein
MQQQIVGQHPTRPATGLWAINHNDLLVFHSHHTHNCMLVQTAAKFALFGIQQSSQTRNERPGKTGERRRRGVGQPQSSHNVSPAGATQAQRSHRPGGARQSQPQVAQRVGQRIHGRRLYYHHVGTVR